MVWEFRVQGLRFRVLGFVMPKAYVNEHLTKSILMLESDFQIF